jgi:hypothetical protein
MLEYSFTTFIPTALVIVMALIFLYLAGTTLFRH